MSPFGAAHRVVIAIFANFIANFVGYKSGFLILSKNPISNLTCITQRVFMLTKFSRAKYLRICLGDELK
jgi:hypothetical protein